MIRGEGDIAEQLLKLSRSCIEHHVDIECQDAYQDTQPYEYCLFELIRKRGRMMGLDDCGMSHEIDINEVREGIVMLKVKWGV